MITLFEYWNLCRYQINEIKLKIDYENKKINTIPGLLMINDNSKTIEDYYNLLCCFYARQMRYLALQRKLISVYTNQMTLSSAYYQIIMGYSYNLSQMYKLEINNIYEDLSIPYYNSLDLWSAVSTNELEIKLQEYYILIQNSINIIQQEHTIIINIFDNFRSNVPYNTHGVNCNLIIYFRYYTDNFIILLRKYYILVYEIEAIKVILKFRS